MPCSVTVSPDSASHSFGPSPNSSGRRSPARWLFVGFIGYLSRDLGRASIVGRPVRLFRQHRLASPSTPHSGHAHIGRRIPVAPELEAASGLRVAVAESACAAVAVVRARLAADRNVSHQGGKGQARLTGHTRLLALPPYPEPKIILEAFVVGWLDSVWPGRGGSPVRRTKEDKQTCRQDTTRDVADDLHAHCDLLTTALASASEWPRPRCTLRPSRSVRRAPRRTDRRPRPSSPSRSRLGACS